jgi:hypothetical protein
MSAHEDNAALLWRDGGDSHAEWHVLVPAPGANGGFVEKRCYLFKQTSVGCSLYIDDELVPLSSSDSSVWEWQPRFFAGEVTAELQRPDGSSSTLFLLDVAPDPRKIGRELFDLMVKELWAEDPTLVIGEEPATTATGELGTLEDPWVAFARLRRYVPEVFRALAPIKQAPRRILRVRRDSAPLHHVRRIDNRTAISVLRSPAVSMLITHPDDAPAVCSESHVDVPAIEETVDGAANRAILVLLKALSRRAQTVLVRLQADVDREIVSETRTPLAARWPVRRKFLQNVVMQLGIVSRRFPFTEVRRPEITAAGLTAIAADPLYARLWSRGWRALRNGFESDLCAERLWISPSWEIYERWCFLRVGKLLASTKPSWHWSMSRKPYRWIGVGRHARAELTLQPTFRAHSGKMEGKWSISKERVPDLLLTVERGPATRFLLLDAKYRTSRQAVLDAMESAHIYQDSLRIGRTRADATLLVVPAISDTAWLAEAEFVAEHRVGIFQLSPHETPSLPKAINSILGSDAL